MSSSGESFGIDIHAVVACEAPRDARVRQARVPRWAKIALAAAVTTHLARAGAAEADPLAAQPTPFQTPLTWGNLPPPTTLVNLETPIGAFTLPIGYLGNRYMLRDQPFVTAPDGARKFSGPLSFRFEYPSGGMNGNTAWIMVVRDGDGRVVPGRTVVYIDKAAPPNSRNDDLEANTLGTYAPGTLVHDHRHSSGEHESLMGVAAGAGPGHRIGVQLACEVNCLVSFYLEQQRVVLEGAMDGRLRHDGLAVAEQAQALFEGWRTTPAGKGD